MEVTTVTAAGSNRDRTKRREGPGQTGKLDARAVPLEL